MRGSLREHVEDEATERCKGTNKESITLKKVSWIVSVLLADTVEVPPDSGKGGESESGSSSNVLAMFEPRVKEGNLRYPSSGSKRIKI